MKKSISGIRGVVGGDLGLKDVMRFCGGFAGIAGSRCAIATDTRPSGPMVRDAAAAALMQNGVDVLDLGVAPTPVVFYEARKCGAGLVISASHNPLEWNGLKFVVDGRGIDGAGLQAVVSGDGRGVGRIGTHSHTTTDYTGAAQKTIGKIDGSPNIIIDVCGGAAASVAPGLLRGIGCEVSILNAEPGASSSGPDPTSDGLNELRAGSHGYDLGFAFDLDGDRLVVVRDGKIQAPDATLGLGVAKALEMGYRSFVLSIDTSTAIERLVEQGGGTVRRSAVGEANVVGMILKSGADAGGEGSSAGFILPRFNYCRDGLLTSGLIASMIGSDSMDEVLSLVDGYHSIREKVSAESALHETILEDVRRKLESDFDEIITIDGIKALRKDGAWVLIRKSNTEDAIRISAESDCMEKTNRIISQTKELVSRSHEEAK